MSPAAVEFADGPDGVSVFLRREPRIFRRAGSVLIQVGTGVAVVSLLAVVVVGNMPQVGGTPWWILLPFGLAALCCVASGIYLRCCDGKSSTTKIAVDALALTVAERFLWFTKRVIISRAVIRSFIVEPALPQPNGRRRSKSGILGDLAQIRVLLETGASKWFALGYPKEVLATVAEELARLCAPARTLPPELAPGSPGSAAGFGQRIAIRLDRPASSPIRFEQHADGITFIVPPEGVRRGSKGLFHLAVLLCLLGAPMTVAAIDEAIGDNDFDWTTFLLTLPLAVGLLLLAIAFNIGRRRAVLAVVRGRLLVMRADLFGSHRREWDRTDLMAIDVAPSGMVVNDTPVLQLRIETRNGTVFKMLTGRPEPELDWIVVHLRRSLQLGEKAPDAPAIAREEKA